MMFEGAIAFHLVEVQEDSAAIPELVVFGEYVEVGSKSDHSPDSRIK